MSNSKPDAWIGMAGWLLSRTGGCESTWIPKKIVALKERMPRSLPARSLRSKDSIFIRIVIHRSYQLWSLQDGPSLASSLRWLLTSARARSSSIPLRKISSPTSSGWIVTRTRCPFGCCGGTSYGAHVADKGPVIVGPGSGDDFTKQLQGCWWLATKHRDQIGVVLSNGREGSEGQLKDDGALNWTSIQHFLYRPIAAPWLIF